MAQYAPGRLQDDLNTAAGPTAAPAVGGRGWALQAMSDQRHSRFGPDPNVYSVCPAAFLDQASIQSGPPSQTYISLSGTFR
eukprot:7284551-Pyramimonas_sp.AAC.1